MLQAIGARRQLSTIAGQLLGKENHKFQYKKGDEDVTFKVRVR